MQQTINETLIALYNCGIVKENIEKMIIQEVENQLLTYSIISFILGIIAGYIIKRSFK